jgi:hypothetical protein
MSPGLEKCFGVLYETMIDPEFGRSNETDKAPRVFADRKDGIENGFWEMINNDVSTLTSTISDLDVF